MEDKKNTFDSAFEEKIPQAMLIDNIWAEQICEVLKPELFNLAHTQIISEILMQHFFAYKVFPSINLLEDICKKDIDDAVLSKKCLSYILKMRQNPLNNDIEYVKDKALEFFRLQTVGRALSEEILPRIESGENLEDIVAIFQRAVSKGTSAHIGYDYNDDEDKRFHDVKEEKIASKWKYLDDILAGGFGAKRLITWIGSAGAGKSTALVACGSGALLAGKTVVHYTLELDDLETARKYDACLTGVDINNVCLEKDKILKSLSDKLPPTAHLIIKEYPMKSASVQTIKSHLARLKLKGIVADLVVIDYGDLLRVAEQGPREEKRHGLEAIWQDMKALAQVLNIPIVTATQTNRSGYQADLITPDQVSEDFTKIMTSDVVITMARNMEQKAAGVGKMYIAKNRQGKDGQIFAYSLNTANAQIEMFDLTDDVEKKIAGEPVDELEDAQNKLKKFLKRKV
jgi:replicative DNA helicase